MPEDKSLGSKLLGLFVDVGDGTPSQGTPAVESQEKSAAELVAELASQSDPRKAPAAAPAPRPGATTATPGPTPGAGSGPVTRRSAWPPRPSSRRWTPGCG